MPYRPQGDSSRARNRLRSSWPPRKAGTSSGAPNMSPAFASSSREDPDQPDMEASGISRMVQGLGLGGVADEIQRRDLFPP